jgi:hypothetical protein
MYASNRWTGSLTYMEANKGYMLRRVAADSVSFIYPMVSGSLSHSPRRTPVKEEDGYSNYHFAENMSVIATSLDLQLGDRINAYVNGELRGIGECVENGALPLSFITLVGSEKNGSIHFEMERGGKTIGSTGVNFNYIPNTVKGTMELPIVLDFGEKSIDAGTLNATVFPNPFRSNFKIEIEIEQDAQVDIQVIDAAGRTVLTQNANALFSGTNTISVNGSDLAVGIYIVKITTGSNTGAYILEKIK